MKLLDSIRKHRGEPALVISCLIALSVVYLRVRASLHPRTGDTAGHLAAGVVSSLLPFFVGMLLLQFAVAAWRIYRKQQTVIASTPESDKC